MLMDDKYCSHLIWPVFVKTASKSCLQCNIEVFLTAGWKVSSVIPAVPTEISRWYNYYLHNSKHNKHSHLQLMWFASSLQALRHCLLEQYTVSHFLKKTKTNLLNTFGKNYQWNPHAVWKIFEIWFSKIQMHSSFVK